jgi:hypothetical protein
MSLREKTLNGAKWSAIATVIIIGLGLIQMTVLARIIDSHQFGLLTVSLVIIALADTLSDFGIANSIIQRKEISHLELTTLYWLNVGLGLVVCVAVFLLSDAIGDVLNNPDLAPLIKTLTLAFVVIPHGQQFRALMQKELEFNKIGMIETSAPALATAAVDLYQDRERWTEAQEQSRQLPARRYDYARHAPALVACLEQCRENLAAHRRNNFTGSMLRHHAHKSTQYMSQWIEAKNRTV